MSPFLFDLWIALLVQLGHIYGFLKIPMTNISPLWLGPIWYTQISHVSRHIVSGEDGVHRLECPQNGTLHDEKARAGQTGRYFPGGKLVVKYGTPLKQFI
jgi:hypothetical protein